MILFSSTYQIDFHRLVFSLLIANQYYLYRCLCLFDHRRLLIQLQISRNQKKVNKISNKNQYYLTLLVIGATMELKPFKLAESLLLSIIEPK